MKAFILLLFISIPSIAQRIYFHSYEIGSQNYSLRVAAKDSIGSLAEGVFLGPKWKLFNSNLLGSTTNSIYQLSSQNVASSREEIYRTKGFIQDFCITRQAIYTIEASDEQHLFNDSRCYRINRKNGKKVSLNALRDKNLYEIYASEFSESFAVIEKNEGEMVIWFCDPDKNKYQPLEVLDLSKEIVLDLNIHNKIIWISPSKIALLVKNTRDGNFEIWELNPALKFKNVVATNVGRLLDFDYFNGQYYFLTEESTATSSDGNFKLQLIKDDDSTLISGFKIDK